MSLMGDRLHQFWIFAQAWKHGARADEKAHISFTEVLDGDIVRENLTKEFDEGVGLEQGRSRSTAKTDRPSQEKP